ncbi:hypothetical protein [Streptomyces sp. NPDC001970]
MAYKKFAALAIAVPVMLVGLGAAPAAAQSNGECSWGPYDVDTTVAY